MLFLSIQHGDTITIADDNDVIKDRINKAYTTCCGLSLPYNPLLSDRDLGVEVRKHLEGMRDPKQELWKPFYTLMYATTAWS
ncbi:unnamed protein product [Adineta ricciae]|uniref:Uncharacterized protein n=1 Tax=Adineta ricciae TaxID=249248 RepID=A0A813QH84_ADIRI|nr:unnamed protein product [Adineta ricciae]